MGLPMRNTLQSVDARVADPHCKLVTLWRQHWTSRVALNGMQVHEHAGCMELSDKYTQFASQVAQLTAENERLCGEMDGVGHAKPDNEVQRLWSLVNVATSESLFQSQPPRSSRTQNVIPCLS